MSGSPKAPAPRGIPINRERCGVLDAKNKQAHSCPQELPIRLYGDPSIKHLPTSLHLLRPRRFLSSLGLFSNFHTTTWNSKHIACQKWHRAWSIEIRTRSKRSEVRYQRSENREQLESRSIVWLEQVTICDMLTLVSPFPA